MFDLLEPRARVFEIEAAFDTSPQNKIGVTVVVKISEDAAGGIPLDGEFQSIGNFFEGAIATVPEKELIALGEKS